MGQRNDQNMIVAEEGSLSPGNYRFVLKFPSIYV